METIDIYDAHKRLTGRTAARGAALAPGEYWFSLKVLIFDLTGEHLLIQQRQASKSFFPGRWDFTVAGGVKSGEALYQAAERELREELGLAMDLSALTSRMTMGWHDGWSEIFFLKADIDLSALTLQRSEVAAVRWVTQAELTQLVADGAFIPYIYAPHVFDYIRSEDEYLT